MELFSTDFLTALLSIIVIDLVLAGDNAIVIGLAARNLPRELQKKAIVWGTVGAIAIRALATLAVVWLLKLPLLLLIGGLFLIWIAYKLLVDKKDHSAISAKPQLGAAIRTIVIADAVMGFDNVIAVAGASHGSFLLVIIGLLISVPVVVWGSSLFIRWIERYPWIVYAGSAVLAFTAGKMITGEKLVHPFFEANPVLKWVIVGIVTAGVLIAALWKNMIGFVVGVNAKGQLTLPSELRERADIRPEDSFTVHKDENGRFVLVKQSAGETISSAG